MFQEIFMNVKKSGPIIHNITNYVTANDCANIILACGASPIMADDVNEAAEITAFCNALVINTGTLSERVIPSMIRAGKKANELKLPVILDPVGIGASAFRKETILRLLEEVRFDVIRGNASEIGIVQNSDSCSRSGIDAREADLTTEDNSVEIVKSFIQLAKQQNSVIVVTGAIDIVADSTKAYLIRNGNPIMCRITGTGCMLSAVIGAMCAANPQRITEAAAAGVCAMGISGEQAYDRIRADKSGTASFKMHLMDAMSCMEGKQLEKSVRYEIQWA